MGRGCRVAHERQEDIITITTTHTPNNLFYTWTIDLDPDGGICNNNQRTHNQRCTDSRWRAPGRTPWQRRCRRETCGRNKSGSRRYGRRRHLCWRAGGGWLARGRGGGWGRGRSGGRGGSGPWDWRGGGGGRGRRGRRRSGCRLHTARYWQIRNSWTSFTPSNPTSVMN